jgi:DNA-binding CsgD family transcriptional regulator
MLRKFFAPDSAAYHSPATVLSDREYQAFHRLGRGDSTCEIADDLGVNLKTVQTYCARIKEKLDIADGLELSHVAFRWHE